MPRVSLARRTAGNRAPTSSGRSPAPRGTRLAPSARKPQPGGPRPRCWPAASRRGGPCRGGSPRTTARGAGPRGGATRGRRKDDSAAGTHQIADSYIAENAPRCLALPYPPSPDRTKSPTRRPPDAASPSPLRGRGGLSAPRPPSLGAREGGPGSHPPGREGVDATPASGKRKAAATTAAAAATAAASASRGGGSGPSAGERRPLRAGCKTQTAAACFRDSDACKQVSPMRKQSRKSRQ
mmetsp:Transcript_12263/g.29123  ORF Transcript_12263/g.29123 Transcript_12263/m.29123 type:complete len:239 (-) Transcript_12263:72-788(-)